MYLEYPIESSYYCNNLGAATGVNHFYPGIGRTLYNYIIDAKPNVIIEFGVLHGFSTTCMAQALRDIGTGKIYGYDLWEREKYNHGQRLSQVKNTLEKYNLNKFVELRSGDIFNVLQSNDIDFEYVDLIHIDVNNDGDKLSRIFDLLQTKSYNGDILFEGGIEARDNCWWMKKFNKSPICNLQFEILNLNYPGISRIKQKRN